MRRPQQRKHVTRKKEFVEVFSPVTPVKRVGRGEAESEVV